VGRPKKSTPAHVEPEFESQEIPAEGPEVEEEEAGEPAPAAGKAISKAAAVRDALAQGEDSPEGGIAFIKKVHGIDMTRQMFSSYKAQQKARDAKQAAASPKAKPGRKPKVASPAPAQPPVALRSANGQADLLDALTAMKPLIAQYGAEQVKKMVDLLG
jgi:hypothetical protein